MHKSIYIKHENPKNKIVKNKIWNVCSLNYPLKTRTNMLQAGVPSVLEKFWTNPQLYF